MPEIFSWTTQWWVLPCLVQSLSLAKHGKEVTLLYSTGLQISPFSCWRKRAGCVSLLLWAAVQRKPAVQRHCLCIKSKRKWFKIIYFRDTCRSLSCSLFIPNVVIKRRWRLGFPQIHKPIASKGVLPAHPNPRQGFKPLGLVTTPFWLLDFPSTPDHRNTAPTTCIEPHPSPFLVWGSAAALTLYTEAALSTQNQHFTRGTALEHVITAICPGVLLTKTGGGWLIAVAFALLLPMGSAACGQLPSAQLHASEFGHLN